MQVAETIAEVRQYLDAPRRAGRRIGLVPTMGALHAGHHTLIERACGECEVVAVSIFVNPLQFGPHEDLDKYPRTRDADLAGCCQRGVDLAFCPDVPAMYGADVKTTVHVSALTEMLCGLSRPGHFDGVCTVVAKLLAIVQPDAAYFGEKDYQQLQVVRRMVHDLSLPVEIVGCPIVREADGLALSSRNAYLTSPQRAVAPALYAALCWAVQAASAGECDARRLEAGARERLNAAGVEDIDYVAVVDPQTLASLERIKASARMCLAARLGATRLIDNIALDCAPDAK